MEITTTFIAATRKEWRAWLRAHHRTAKEIWLVFYKKGSGKPRLPYDEAVEEALCYGWIDSIVKSVNADYYVQRFSPRRPASVLSELNKARIRKLVASKKMTRAGLDAVRRHLHAPAGDSTRPVLRSAPYPKDILAAIRKDPLAWRHFRAFPETYKRVRIGFIEMSRNRPEFFRRRLAYFIRMTARNKRYGQLP